MQYRPGRESDFQHLQTFVWQAIFPAFDRPDLTEEQRGENDRTVETAPARVAAALADPESIVLTAWDERRRALAGFAVATRHGQWARLDQLFVRRADRRHGIGTELLNRVTTRLADQRELLVALRPYQQEAIDFFEQQGFQDTGEPWGEDGPDRRVFVRQLEQYGTENEEVADDFPGPEDEPHFEPVYESLPDYTLASEELSDDPVFDPETSTLDETQLTELEAFIARAKAKKAGRSPEEPHASVAKAPPPAKHPEVEFEIDYGVAQEPGDADAPAEPDPPASDPLSFDFAFDILDPPPAELPPHKPEEEPTAEAEEVLVLEDIPEAQPEPEPKPEVTITQLRSEWEDRLGERLSAYFGADALPALLAVYWKADNFHRIRDAGLAGLAHFLSGHPTAADAARRRDTVLADLVEYFVVETAGEIHGQQFPQRLLRYQGVDWKKVDLFRLVQDYLAFDAEVDVVYTDFVTIPPKVLRNATEQYLRATRDERVYFICDQSLFGSGKQGFAMTDSALYWKNMLHSAGQVMYTTLKRVEPAGDHLLLDGQYFDAGSRLNLRVALLLDKLRRLHLGD